MHFSLADPAALVANRDSLGARTAQSQLPQQAIDARQRASVHEQLLGLSFDRGITKRSEAPFELLAQRTFHVVLRQAAQGFERPLDTLQGARGGSTVGFRQGEYLSFDTREQ